VSELNNKSILEIDDYKYTICMGDVQIVKKFFLELCIDSPTTSQNETLTVARK